MSKFFEFFNLVGTPSGQFLPRKAWVRLNCLRTGWGRTQSFLKTTGASSLDTCQCGASQTIQHIINDCPIFAPPHGSRGLMLFDGETINWLLNADSPV